MSTDIYAKPDLSKKVRYTRKEEGDKEEWKENEVAIYESADDIGIHHFQSHDGGPKQPPADQRKLLIAAVLCLGGLCFVMLTVIILLSNFLNISQDEVKQLKDKIEGKRCPDGWERFGCSCYFRSNEKRTWDESRTDCQKKQADLVVINNEDENKFVRGLNNMNEGSWIGLETEWSTSRSRYEWKWVDGSPLTEIFRTSGLPTTTLNHYPAYCNQQGQWRQGYNHYQKHYICEKRVSCIL